MRETKYRVKIDNDIIAENVNLTTAIILVKGLFNEYHNETILDITISKITNIE